MPGCRVGTWTILVGSTPGPFPIRANSITPGVIETNQTRRQPKDPEWASTMLGKTLLGLLGRPEEVAKVALFLASDESSYVTGIGIVVDGGMKLW
jgi:NAD(P)-dependent dehydrogenase (short-subunit alcohol dehydrogenase family)